MLRKAITLFYLRPSSKKHTIYCRITVDGEENARSTGQKVNKDYWNKETQRVKSESPVSKSINETLSVIENQVREAENTLRMQHEPVTLEKVLDHINNDVPTITILDLFYEHNKKVKERIGVDFAEATYTKYCTIEDDVRHFIRYTYGKEDYYVSDITLQFIEDLEHYFKIYKGLAHNTTLKYLKHFRKIILIALRRGYLQVDPYDGFDRTKDEKIPVHLSLEELQRIEEYDFSEVPRLEHVRDVFVFGCYTGLAYSDLKKLNRETDFYRDNEGDLWLAQGRTKTDEPARVLLLPKAKEIYDKYKDHPDLTDSQVLSVYSNQNSNAYLKEVATLCRVKKNLTTHVARHTFATTITLGYGMPIESVQMMMGHRDRRSTEHYARVTNHKLTNDMKELRRRLESSS